MSAGVSGGAGPVGLIVPRDVRSKSVQDFGIRVGSNLSSGTWDRTHNSRHSSSNAEDVEDMPIARLRTLGSTWAIVALGLGSIYLATLLPGPGFSGDTAKFQFVGKILGVPHEPGYPIYTLLNHVWVSAIPIASVAWRANLLSAALSVLSCVLLYATVRPQTDQLSATVACLLLGLSKQYWINSVVAEVYTLAVLFLALITYFTFRYLQSGETRWAALAILTWGLSLGHHPLVAPAILGVGVAILLKPGKSPRATPLVLAAAVGPLLGLGSYAYLFLRTSNPGTLFLEVPVRSIADLLSAISGGNFRQGMFSLDAIALLHRVPRLVVDVAENVGPALLFLPSGVAAIGRARTGFLAVIILTNVGIYMNYDIPDIEVYVIPSVFACCVTAAFGMHRFRNALEERRRGTVATACVLALPAILLAANFGIANKRDDGEGARAYHDALDAVPDGSVIWEPWYPGREYLLYYLLVDEPARVRSVFIAGTGNVDNIVAYAQAGGSLRSAVRSVVIPPGRPIYVVSRFGIDPLQKRGFEVRNGPAHLLVSGQ